MQLVMISLDNRCTDYQSLCPELRSFELAINKTSFYTADEIELILSRTIP